MTDHQAMRLDQFLKLCGVAGSGGHAKHLIQDGEVLVNGEVETRRRRKLADGDTVGFGGGAYPYVAKADEVNHHDPASSEDES